MDGSGEVNPYIDSSVGALVWVRRRNGSWWPGRILGPEELPGSHLLSPRTGTPVKLLGREDGSVDWYNIEKSRRVKAFRCGDFDECIERAKSLASVLTKKREKYARREDAILHALELEKKHMEQNHFLGRRLFLHSNYREVSNFVDDDMVMDDDDLEGMANRPDFQSDFMGPESSADAAQASLDSLFSLQGDRKFLDTDWEEDIVETIPRIRGLQDLGMQIASLKEQKASWSNGYEYPAADVALSEEEHKVASCITKSAATVPCTAAAMSKRKRASQTGWIEESAYKRQEWQRPLDHGSDNRLKFAGGAAELGSKASVPPFMAGTSGNGFGLLPPKQEQNLATLVNALQMPSELKSSVAGSGPTVWQASQQIQSNLHDSSLIMDRACSSFSDPAKTNCCDGQTHPYAGCQMGVAPLSVSPLVDSYYQGAPCSRCSVLPQSGYNAPVSHANDIGFQKVSSFQLGENFTGPLPNFHMWPSYAHREGLNEFGLPGQVASGRAVGLPDFSFESAIPSPLYPVNHNPLENSSAFTRCGALDKEGSLLLPINDTHAEITYAPVKSCKQCLSTGSEGGDGRPRAREDEADSVQPNQESAICAFKAAGAHGDECGLTQPEGFQATIRPKNAKSAVNMHGFVKTDGCLDEISLHDMSSPSNECSGPDLPYSWQAKGKRRLRIPCRNKFLSPAACARLNMTSRNPLVDEYEDLPEANTSRVKVNRATEPVKYSFDFDFSSEEEEPSKEFGRSRRQLARKPHLCFRSSSDMVKDHQASSWFEVPVEDQISAVLQGEHVPLVSLTSKSKGRSIVGHPVLLERMDRRCAVSRTGGRIKLPLQPVWRTARRTAMQRIPRLCGTVVSQDFAPQRQQQQQTHSSPDDDLMMRKGGSLLFLSADRRRPPRKLVPFSQKTRMLSSIAVQHADKVVEPDTLKAAALPVVTCVPVNVIFNRIREVLYRGTNHTASDSDIS